jgi:zinc protease
MTRIRTIAFALLFAVSAFAQVNDYREIKTPPMRPFTPPSAKRVQLANGMVIFLMEDHELPLIRGTARIRGGGRDMPGEKAGLVSIYGQAWRTGGTAKLTGDQLDEMLESRAAHLETSGSEDSTSVHFDVLKNDFDFAFPLFLDLLRDPQFRQEKIDLAKTQLNTAIARRNDDPQSIIGRESTKLGYGAASPYVRQAEYATVASITRDDLLAFHKRFVHPNNIILGVVGDFDSAKMEKTLRDAFAKWPRGPQAPPPPAAGSPAKPGVYFIAKDDVTQSNIALVGAGTTRNNPDYYAITVLNEILDGGSFSGRLMNDIRTKRGLAYGVGGGIGAPWDHPGLFRIEMGTKSASTVESINALRQELTDLKSQPFTQDELQTAKDLILNAFVFTMDSPEKILGQQMSLEFYGFPLDYYRNYPANIQKVTLADVDRVAKKYVQSPDQLAVLVVGNQKDFDKPLSSLGTVTPIDITIPEPGGGQAPSPVPHATSTSADARALVDKVRTFIGGADKLATVKATHSVLAVNAKTPQGDMAMEFDSIIQFPDREHMVMRMPMGEMTMVFTPDTAFMITPMGTQDMPGSQRENMRRELKTDLLPVLLSADQPSYTFTITGTEKIGDINAQIVEINADGAPLKWWVDPATGRILRKSSQARGAMGHGEAVTEYADWKSFGPLNLPTHFTTTHNGETVATSEVKMIEINPTIDPSMFAKK